MRCPHCAGQIPDRSRFCGICGRKIPADAEASAAVGAGATRGGPPASASTSGGGSMSLFELPVSRGARLARVFSILALDAVLVGTGIAMMLSYMDARDRHRSGPPVVDAGVAKAQVEVLAPEPVRPPPTTSSPTGPRAKVQPAKTAPKARAKARKSSKSKPAAAKPKDKKPPPPPPTRRPPDAGVVPGGGGNPGVDPDDPGPPPSAPPDAGVAPPPPPPTVASVDAGAAPPPPAGGPTEEEITVLANRIGLVVDRKRSQLQRCYSQAAKVTSPDDPLEGKVVIRFEVLPTGKARNVRAMSNTTHSSQLASCLTSLVSSWTFPKASQPIEFAWPFVFKAPK